MDWIQFALFFIGVFGLFVWNRAESRSDARHMDTQLRANSELIRAVHNEIMSEMRDFHGRLERQDAEFKGKIEKQDAEFKAHLLYQHGSKD
jgi:hypothetical protein